MLAIIFTIHRAVMFFVEQPCQLLSAHAVAPYPRFPCLLDLVDLLACCFGGFSVSHQNLLSVAYRFHLHFRRFAVHRQLQQLKRSQVFSAEVVAHLTDIAAVIDVAKPLCGRRKIG